MKRLNMILALAMLALGFASCNGGADDYKIFVGSWGLDRLEYYNIDYAGDPIAGSMVVYNFTPGDTIDGIDLVFNDDQSGVMIDRSRDTLYLNYDPATETYQDTIVCPDTVLYTRFTYTYHKGEPLYMNMETSKIQRLYIEEINDEQFTYTNEYYTDYVEKAKMVRIKDRSNSKDASKAKPVYRTCRPGSLMSNN